LKYERTPQSDADLKRLSNAEFAIFRSVVLDEFESACEQRVAPTLTTPRACPYNGPDT